MNMIYQTYDENIQKFMSDRCIELPTICDMDHPEFAACIGVPDEVGAWSFVNRRNIERIEQADFRANDLALWFSACRTKTRIGRAIRKLYLCAHLAEPKPEYIADIVREWELWSGVGGEYTFELLSGEDIRWAYNEKNSMPRGDGGYGLHESCMRYENCQDFFDLYCKNPQIQLAVLKRGGKIAARALVWGKKWYDRVYPHDNYTEDLLIDNCERGMGLLPCCNHGGEIEIKLDRVDFRKYPYMDSFCYMAMDSVTICNFEPDEQYRQCCSTGGCYDEYNERITCRCCDYRMDRDDQIEVDGEYYCNECAVWSRHYDEYILKDDAVYCSYGDTYLHEDDARELYDGEYCHNEDSIELYNGEYAHYQDNDIVYLQDDSDYPALSSDRDIVYLDYDGFYAEKSDCITDINGDYQLADNCIKVDGVWIHKDETIELYDGRLVHEDDAVSTYNGLIAHVDECVQIKGGAFALLYDPIVQFDRMSRAEISAMVQ